MKFIQPQTKYVNYTLGRMKLSEQFCNRNTIFRNIITKNVTWFGEKL